MRSNFAESFLPVNNFTGAPVIYGAIPTIADMRTMNFLGGAIELGILTAGSAQLAQYYHLPYYAWGGFTDSKIPDIPAGYEKGMTLLMAALPEQIMLIVPPACWNLLPPSLMNNMSHR